MTAPRPREQRRPLSPSDTPRPRRGSGPSSQTASTAGRPGAFARPRGTRRGLLRSARALLALSGALALPAQAQTTCTLNTGDTWCGVVTVGELVSGGETIAYGFKNNPSVGGLSDKDFTYGTNSYTIDIVTVDAGADEGGLRFSLTSGLTNDDRAKLILFVGSNPFTLSSARYRSSGHDYDWLMAGLDWSSEATVTLRLRDDPPAPPPAPAAPAARAPASTAGLLEVNWSAPVAVPPATAYQVKFWKATDPETGPFRRKETTDTSLLLHPLDANTRYKLRVRARNAEGWGPWSAVTVAARTGGAQPGRPVISLHLLDASGNEIDEGAITEGRGVRYRIKATNIRNYHDWGNPGLLGHFRLRSHLEEDRHPPLQSSWNDSAGLISCEATALMREGLSDTQPSFTQTSATAGYWDFRTYPIPSYSAELGPLTLVLQREACGQTRGPRRRDPDIGGPSSACVTIADNGEGPDYDGSDPEMLDEKPTYPCADLRAPSNTLKAWFVSPPPQHDGKKRVKVRVAFSEPVEESPENVGEHGVDGEGGDVTSVSPVGGQAPGGAGTGSKSRSVGSRNDGPQDREVVWEFEIEPDSDGDLTVSLDAGRPCDEPGAICTADGRSLSEGISTTVEGPETGPAGPTAAFEGMPEAHDGESAFTFRVAFSENIGISYRSLREDAFTVTGGRVTGGRRVDDRRDLFEMTVEPDSDGDVTITLPAGRECGVSGAICTNGENRRQLTNTPTATVAGPVVETGPAALTTRFVGMPAEHDGTNGIRFRVAFSEDIGISFRSLREDAFTVTGGRVTGGRRVDDHRDLFEMTVRPDSFADVTIALPGERACGVSGAICTKGENRRKLTNTPSATVRGPVALSVADARAREGEDETIEFAVSLSRSASATVKVSYASADGSAAAGSDYTRTSGTLTFAPGETGKTVSVPVLDDAVDEGEETFTLRLSNASGARIADGVATGTIVNSDPLQKMWLSRFGRTVAGQVVDAVGGPPVGAAWGLAGDAGRATRGYHAERGRGRDRAGGDGPCPRAGRAGRARTRRGRPGRVDACGRLGEPRDGRRALANDDRARSAARKLLPSCGRGRRGRGSGARGLGPDDGGRLRREGAGREGHGASRRRGDERHPRRRRPMGALARGHGALGEQGRGHVRPAGR